MTARGDEQPAGRTKESTKGKAPGRAAQASKGKAPGRAASKGQAPGRAASEGKAPDRAAPATRGKKLVQGAETSPRKPGRPPGSPSLTREAEDKIISLVTNGATPGAAAMASGIHPRTLRDWRARGEDRHPTRKGSPRYRAFAKRLRQARGTARVLAELDLRQRDPRYYLVRTARATEGDEGWADAPVTRTGGAGLPSLAHLSDEELNEALRRIALVAGEQVQTGAHPRRRAPRTGKR